MSEGEEFKRRRRSSQEIQRLVAEFGTSGLRQSEFCRIHGLTHGTLQRGLRKERIDSDSQEEIKGLVAVEVTDGDATVRRKLEEGRCGLEVILAKGRRIELSRDFDAVQLRRAVEALEGF
jgi:transposase-like protein